jgi:altronate hydrolase
MCALPEAGLQCAIGHADGEDIDIDCSPILSGMAVEELGQRIFRKLLDVASGEPTKSEAQGVGDYEFVPWQLGAWV